MTANQDGIYRAAGTIKMLNAKCRMLNQCVAKGDYLKNFRRKYHNFALCIMNYAFSNRGEGNAIKGNA